MSALDEFIVFWKGMTKRIGVKLTDKLLIGNVDTEKPQYIDVQDLPFINQSALDAEATARADADAAIKNAADIYNVTQKHPLSSGYYTPDAARAAVPAAIRKDGLIITYQASLLGIPLWITEQFASRGVSSWSSSYSWKTINSEIKTLTGPSFDTIFDTGIYAIINVDISEESEVIKYNGYLFVTSETCDEQPRVVKQTRITDKGIETRTGKVTDEWRWTEWKEIITDLTDVNSDISVLKENSFKYLEADTNLNTVTTSGAYCIGGEEAPRGGILPSLKYRDFLFVTGGAVSGLMEENDITQYRINRDGISMRRHYTRNTTTGTVERWEDWTLIATAEYIDSFISANIKKVTETLASYLGKDNAPILDDNGSTVSIVSNRKFLIPTLELSGNASRYYVRNSNGYMAAATKAQMQEQLGIGEPVGEAPKDGNLYARRDGQWVALSS